MAKSNRRKHSVKGEWKMAEPQAKPPKLTDEIASISKDIDIFTGWLVTSQKVLIKDEKYLDNINFVC
jgi:hypothetical protein